MTNNIKKGRLHTKKLPAWIVVLALLICGTVGAIIGEMNTGNNNITISKSVTVDEIRMLGTMNEDDSSTFVIAEDGLSFVISMQVNNNDWYEYWVILWNDANRDVDVHLECPLDKDFLTDDNIKVEIDSQHFGLRLNEDEWAFTVESKNTGIVSMNISVDATVPPGFYQIPFKLTDWEINAHIENSHNPNTDPGDYDGDGIPNDQETNGGGGEQNPFDADIDDDGLLTISEDLNGNGVVDAGETDPNNPDTDGDGLNDGLERGLTTAEGVGTEDTWKPDTDPTTKSDPLDADSDNDGLLDGQEDKNENGKVDAGETNPTDTDSDDDGLTDNNEDKDLDAIVDTDETDPADFDTDNDGLPDGLEKAITSDTSPKGTSDGANNGYRVIFVGTDITSSNFITDTDPGTTTNPLDDDCDDDGLIDGVGSIGEDQNKNGLKDVDETDPNVFDTDSDGLGDGQEQGLKKGEGTGTKSGPFVADSFSESNTDPLDDDTDDDNILDGDEDKNHDGHIAGDVNLNFVWDDGETWTETDPNDSDTDNDTLGDGEEIIYEFDPLNPEDPAIELPKGEIHAQKDSITFEYTLFDFTKDSDTEIFIGLTNEDFPWGLNLPIKIPFGIPWVLALWFGMEMGFSLEFKLGIEIQAYCKISFTYERWSWYNPNDVKEDGTFNYITKYELDSTKIDFLFSVQPFAWVEFRGWISGSIEYEVLGVSGTLVEGGLDDSYLLGDKDGNDHWVNIDFRGDNALDSSKFTEVISGQNVAGVNLFHPIGTIIQRPPMGITLSDWLPHLDVAFGSSDLGINVKFDAFAEAGFYFELVSDLQEQVQAVIDNVPQDVVFSQDNTYYNCGDYIYNKITLPNGCSGDDLKIISNNFKQVFEALFRYYYKFGMSGHLGLDVEIPDIEIDLFFFEINIPLPDIHEKWYLPDFLLQQKGVQANKKSWGRLTILPPLKRTAEGDPTITQTSEIYDKDGSAHSHEYDVSTYSQNALAELDIDESLDWDIGGIDFSLQYGLDLEPHMDINAKLHTRCEKDTRKTRDVYNYVASMDSDEANDGNFWVNNNFYIKFLIDFPSFPNPFEFLNDLDFLDLFDDLPPDIDIPEITVFELSSQFLFGHYIQVPIYFNSIDIPVVPPFIDFSLDFFGSYITDGVDQRMPITISEDSRSAPGEWETSPIVRLAVTPSMVFGVGSFKPFYVEFAAFTIDLILKGEGYYKGDLSFTEESHFWSDETVEDLKFDNPGDYYTCNQLYSHFINGPVEGRSTDTFTAKFHNMQYVLEKLELTARFAGEVYVTLHPIYMNKDIPIFDFVDVVNPLPVKDIYDKNTVDIPPFP